MTLSNLPLTGRHGTGSGPPLPPHAIFIPGLSASAVAFYAVRIGLPWEVGAVVGGVCFAGLLCRLFRWRISLIFALVAVALYWVPGFLLVFSWVFYFGPVGLLYTWFVPVFLAIGALALAAGFTVALAVATDWRPALVSVGVGFLCSVVVAAIVFKPASPPYQRPVAPRSAVNCPGSGEINS